MFYYFCFLLCLVPLSHCANILALIPAASDSHQITFVPLWRALSLRGHNITLLTADPVNDSKLTNLTELDMKWAYKCSSNITHNVQTRINMWNYHSAIWKDMTKISEKILSSKVVQSLLHEDNNFDLVLVEQQSPELLAFAELYKCPKILISSMNLPSIYFYLMGESSHPILHPEYITSFHGKLNFKERVISPLVTWYTHYLLTYEIFPSRQYLLERYFNTTSTIPDMIHDIDMLFINTNPIIHGARAMGPAIIPVGGYGEDISLKPMSSDLRKFLDDAKEGCIYLNMGSNIRSSHFNQQLLKTITDALSEVPYKVVWNFEAEFVNIPKNIKIVKWFPQQKVLNHPNVKLLIFQGSLQSIEESIYGEVPSVVLPFFADQYQNAKILENKGIAIVLDRTNLKKSELKNTIIKLITDHKYRNRVKELKKLILDQPMTGLEKAIWWTEYVIRNKGAKHLRNPAADLPLYQYFLLDVIGFFLIITVITFMAILALSRAYTTLVNVFGYKKQKVQ